MYQKALNLMRRCAVLLAALAAIAAPASVLASHAASIAGDPDDGGQLPAAPNSGEQSWPLGPSISGSSLWSETLPSDGGPDLDPPPSSTGSGGSGTGQ